MNKFKKVKKAPKAKREARDSIYQRLGEFYDWAEKYADHWEFYNDSIPTIARKLYTGMDSEPDFRCAVQEFLESSCMNINSFYAELRQLAKSEA